MPLLPESADSPEPSEGEAIERLPDRVWESEVLFEGRNEIRIVHRGEIYRLRITRNDKLILHK